MLLFGLFVVSLFGGETKSTSGVLYPSSELVDIRTPSALVIDGTTVQVCGDDVYDYVVIRNGGTAEICAKNATPGTGYWNVTANIYFNLTSDSTITGVGKGWLGGNDAGHDQIISKGQGPGGGGAGTRLPVMAGGGGGGHGGAGGCGGCNSGGCWAGGGGSYGSAIDKTLTIGSGGGETGQTSTVERNGGNGGAGVYIKSPIIEFHGTANLYGQGGEGGTTQCNPGGGGGAGGSLVLDGTDINITSATINLYGGSGGSCHTGCDCGGGGGGGGGRFKVFYSNSFENISTTINVAGGNGGAGINVPPASHGQPGGSGTIYYEQIQSEVPVGGISIPVNKLELLAPYIGLAILLAVAVISIVYVKRRKRNTEIIS